MESRQLQHGSWTEETLMIMLIFTVLVLIFSAITQDRPVPTPGAATMRAAAQAEAEGSHVAAHGSTLSELVAQARILLDPDSDGRPDSAIDERHDTGDTGE